MYSSYTAASFARIHDLAEQHGVNIEGALTWAFEFEDQPYFAGFRSLASNGIDKPVLNVFRMFAKMSGPQLAVESDSAVPLEEVVRSGVGAKPDVSALSSLVGNKLSVLVWHYHDDDVPGPKAEVQLRLNNLPSRSGDLRVQQWRIDEDHSNAYAAWQRLGTPQQPTAEQYAQLEKAGQLTEVAEPIAITDEGSIVMMKFLLPRQAVSLLKLTW
jgi:xylan 1,4-beta-xylosidase